MFFYTDTSNENSQNTDVYDEFKTFLSIIVCEIVQKSLDYNEEIEKNLISLLFHLINNFHYLTYDNEEIKENEKIFINNYYNANILFYFVFSRIFK